MSRASFFNDKQRQAKRIMKRELFLEQVKVKMAAKANYPKRRNIPNYPEGSGTKISRPKMNLEVKNEAGRRRSWVVRGGWKNGGLHDW